MIPKLIQVGDATWVNPEKINGFVYHSRWAEIILSGSAPVRIDGPWVDIVKETLIKKTVEEITE